MSYRLPDFRKGMDLLSIPDSPVDGESRKRRNRTGLLHDESGMLGVLSPDLVGPSVKEESDRVVSRRLPDGESGLFRMRVLDNRDFGEDAGVYHIGAYVS